MHRCASAQPRSRRGIIQCAAAASIWLVSAAISFSICCLKTDRVQELRKNESEAVERLKKGKIRLQLATCHPLKSLTIPQAFDYSIVHRQYRRFQRYLSSDCQWTVQAKFWWMDSNDEFRELSNLPMLDTVYANSSWITDAGILTTNPCPHLRNIEFSNCWVSGNGLSKFSALESVRLRKCRVTDLALEDLGRLKNLHTLEISGPFGSGWDKLLTDDGLQRLLANLDLKELSLRDTGIQNIELLRNMKSLRRLDIGFTKIDDADLPALNELSKLEDLRLDGCKISSIAALQLERLPSLRVLSLSKTQIDDQALTTIRRAPGLVSLNVGQTTISLSAVNELRKQLPTTLVSWRAQKTVDTAKTPSKKKNVSIDLSSVGKAKEAPKPVTKDTQNWSVSFKTGQPIRYRYSVTPAGSVPKTDQEEAPEPVSDQKVGKAVNQSVDAAVGILPQSYVSNNLLGFAMKVMISAARGIEKEPEKAPAKPSK